MRVLFYTAAALAATLASVSQAVRLESNDLFDDVYDRFPETDCELGEDPAGMTDAELDKEM